jgi:hypothetical protein
MQIVGGGEKICSPSLTSRATRLLTFFGKQTQRTEGKKKKRWASALCEELFAETQSPKKKMSLL